MPSRSTRPDNPPYRPGTEYIFWGWHPDSHDLTSVEDSFDEWKRNKRELNLPECAVLESIDEIIAHKNFPVCFEQLDDDLGLRAISGTYRGCYDFKGPTTEDEAKATVERITKLMKAHPTWYFFPLAKSQFSWTRKHLDTWPGYSRFLRDPDDMREDLKDSELLEINTWPGFVALAWSDFRPREWSIKVERRIDREVKPRWQS